MKCLFILLVGIASVIIVKLEIPKQLLLLSESVNRIQKPTSITTINHIWQDELKFQGMKFQAMKFQANQNDINFIPSVIYIIVLPLTFSLLFVYTINTFPRTKHYLEIIIELSFLCIFILIIGWRIYCDCFLHGSC